MAESTKKATTTTASSTARNTTRKSTPKTTPLLERERTVLAEEATYATAALIDEALGLARSLPTRVTELREQAPNRVGELRKQVETSIQDLQSRATRQLETRVATFETSFDSRVKAGRKVADRARKDERVAKVERQLGRVWDQTGNTRSQVKAAVTSLRKTVDTAVDAGKQVAS